jgi:hypothetical protein
MNHGARRNRRSSSLASFPILGYHVSSKLESGFTEHDKGPRRHSLLGRHFLGRLQSVGKGLIRKRSRVTRLFSCRCPASAAANLDADLHQVCSTSDLRCLPDIDRRWPHLRQPISPGHVHSLRSPLPSPRPFQTDLNLLSEVLMDASQHRPAPWSFQAKRPRDRLPELSHVFSHVVGVVGLGVGPANPVFTGAGGASSTHRRCVLQRVLSCVAGLPSREREALSCGLHLAAFEVRTRRSRLAAPR